MYAQVNDDVYNFAGRRIFAPTIDITHCQCNHMNVFRCLAISLVIINICSCYLPANKFSIANRERLAVGNWQITNISIDKLSDTDQTSVLLTMQYFSQDGQRHYPYFESDIVLDSVVVESPEKYFRAKLSTNEVYKTFYLKTGERQILSMTRVEKYTSNTFILHSSRDTLIFRIPKAQSIEEDSSKHKSLQDFEKKNKLYTDLVNLFENNPNLSSAEQYLTSQGFRLPKGIKRLKIAFELKNINRLTSSLIENKLIQVEIKRGVTWEWYLGI